MNLCPERETCNSFIKLRMLDKYAFWLEFSFWMNKFSNYVFCLDSKMLSAFYASHIYGWKCILILDDQILELHFLCGERYAHRFLCRLCMLLETCVSSFLTSVWSSSLWMINPCRGLACRSFLNLKQRILQNVLFEWQETWFVLWVWGQIRSCCQHLPMVVQFLAKI